MNTPGSRKCSDRRIRSPRSAPCVNGLDGSTEMTPTLLSSARISRTSAVIRLDLPTPGGPVIPTTYAEPVSGYTSRTSSYASGSPFSTSVIARASASRSPSRTPAASVSPVHSRRRATSGAGLHYLRLDHRAADPTRERVAHERGEPGQARGDAPDPARTELVRQRPSEDHSEPEDR